MGIQSPDTDDEKGKRKMVFLIAIFFLLDSVIFREIISRQVSKSIFVNKYISINLTCNSVIV